MNASMGVSERKTRGSNFSAGAKSKSGSQYFSVFVIRDHQPGRSERASRMAERALWFTPHVSCLLVIPQRHEPRMAHVTIRSPLGEFKLPDQHRPEPPTVRHLRRSEALSPATA